MGYSTKKISIPSVSSYLGTSYYSSFLLRTHPNHRTEREGGDHFILVNNILHAISIQSRGL